MGDMYGRDAWVYDAAFSWDVTAEAKWLHERLGEEVVSVFEPACGTGRVLEALARRGLRVTGLDASPSMLARARARFAAEGLPEPRLVVGDMTDFADTDLGGPLDGAVCPVDSIAYVTTDAGVARHLVHLARHLAPGARYLVQLGLVDVGAFELREPGPTSRWDTPHERGTVRCSVSGRAWDQATRIETVVTRFELVDGPEQGLVIEEEQAMRALDWTAWAALIEDSPFRQVGAWNGNAKGRPALSLGPGLEGEMLTWHELVLG